MSLAPARIPRHRVARSLKQSVSRKRAKSLPPAAGYPPSISFRTFKSALSKLKRYDPIPPRLDRVWANRLYGEHQRETLKAFRFLGLVDNKVVATPRMVELLWVLETSEWPNALRSLLSDAYTPLLATSITLSGSGLLQAIRETYSTEAQVTRRCAQFLHHAAREAGLEGLPGLQTPIKNKASPSRVPTQIKTIESLVTKLPQWDASWAEETRNLWLKAYLELAERLSRDQN